MKNICFTLGEPSYPILTASGIDKDGFDPVNTKASTNMPTVNKHPMIASLLAWTNVKGDSPFDISSNSLIKMYNATQAIACDNSIGIVPIPNGSVRTGKIDGSNATTMLVPKRTTAIATLSTSTTLNISPIILLALFMRKNEVCILSASSESIVVGTLSQRSE